MNFKMCLKIKNTNDRHINNTQEGFIVLIKHTMGRS